MNDKLQGVRIFCATFFSFTCQELTLRMERMTDDAAKKKRELEHELTLTMTAQVSYMKLIVLVMSDLLCVTILTPQGWIWSHTGCEDDFACLV